MSPCASFVTIFVGLVLIGAGFAFLWEHDGR